MTVVRLTQADRLHPRVIAASQSLGAGTLDTKGGPKLNASAQVLDSEDRPIIGL